MTDTGRIPGEGLPEYPGAEAGGDPLAPPHTGLPDNGVPQQSGWGTEPMTDQNAPGYTFLDHPAPPGTGLEDEDDVLLMPGPQGSWSDPQPVPPPTPAHAAVSAQGPAPVQMPMTAPSTMPAPLPPAVGLPITVEVPVEVPLETVTPAALGGVGYVHAPAAGPAPVAPVPVAPGPPAGAGLPTPVAGPGVAAQAPEAVAPAAGPGAVAAPVAAPAAEGAESGAAQGVAAEPAAAQPVALQPVEAQAPVAAPADGEALSGHPGGAPAAEAVQAAAAPTPAPRRPLHMGPPVNDTPSGGVSVRSLADRGPAVSVPGPATSGPEYLDVPRDDTTGIPAQQTGESGEPAAPTPGSVWPAAGGGASQQSLIPRAESVPQAENPAAAPDLPAAPAEAAVQQPVQAPAQPQAQTAVQAPVQAPVQPVQVAEQAPVPVPASAPAVEQAAPVEAVAPVEGAAPEAVQAAAPAAVPVAPEQVPEPVAEAAPVAPPAAAAAPEAVIPAQGGPVGSVSAGIPAQTGGPQFVAVVADGQLPGGGGPLATPPEAVAEAGVEGGVEVGGAPVETAPADGSGAESAPVAAAAADAGTAAPAAEVPVAEVPAQAVPDEVAQPEAAVVAAPVVAEPVQPSEPVQPGRPVEPAEPAENAAQVAPAEDAGTAQAPAAEPQVAAPAGESAPAEPAAAEAVPAEAVPAEAVPAEAEAVPVPAEPLPGKGRRGRRRAAPAVETPEQSAEPAAAAAPVAVPPADPDPDTAPEADPQPSAEVDADTPPQPESQPSPEPQPVAAVAAARTPAAEAYEPAVRDAVHRVIRERRDIRNGFRSDPIPHDVLLRVLEAAHTAPSVGHSQPWDFVVIRSEKTREKMHELAMLQREAYAKSLPKGRARQFRELKIEAILDTPVNIVVTADPTRGGRHTLGRHTQPQMAPYSSALAVENLWLAARAEGLGVGWVSFFDERQMVSELGLPEHLEVVAYLCVGYVDEFPEEPELMQAGWSQRRPLSWVVHDEEYGNRALPGEQPHDLLEETLRGIRPLDAKALGEAWERQKRMTKPAGALGMLEIISAQLSGLSRQCPPPIPEPAAVAIFAGDHGVHAQGVTSWPQEVTGQMVANFLGGGAVCNAFANQVGAEVCVVDVGVASELPATPGLLPRKVRPGTADFTVGPAMSREEVLRAIDVGIETARDLVAAGNKALLTGEMGIANTTPSAALISVYTGVDPAEVTGRGTGINDEMHARKIEVVRRALDLHRPDPGDPIAVLAAIGGLEHAAMVGLLLGAAALRTPVILDGVSAGAAALVARAIAPEVLAACIAGHRSAEPGHVAALTTLGLRPLVDLDLRLGEGTGALLALPLVQSAARVMHEVATFDAAGVTEKG